MFTKFLRAFRGQFSSLKFEIKRDPYESLLVYMNNKATSQQVRTYLQSQQAIQKQSNSSAIWVFLNSENLQHAGLIVNEFGFKIHHGMNNKIALYKWLSNRSDLVPPYSSFYISCGSVVINNDHVLLVQQNNGPRKGLYGIPGGRADIGEFLQNTAQRQLFQQTGIVAKFQHFLYFRLMQNTVFGAGDLYFVCLMKAEQQRLKNIKLCDRELSSFKWVHLSKLQEFITEKAVGTQQQVGRYLSDLYKSGYRFQTQNPQNYPNFSRQSVFTKSFDGVHRKFRDCRLININQKKSEKVVV